MSCPTHSPGSTSDKDKFMSNMDWTYFALRKTREERQRYDDAPNYVRYPRKWAVF